MILERFSKESFLRQNCSSFRFCDNLVDWLQSSFAVSFGSSNRFFFVRCFSDPEISHCLASQKNICIILRFLTLPGDNLTRLFSRNDWLMMTVIVNVTCGNVTVRWHFASFQWKSWDNGGLRQRFPLFNYFQTLTIKITDIGIAHLFIVRLYNEALLKSSAMQVNNY